VCTAKRRDFRGVADNDKTYRDTSRFEFRFELAQLREWFSEKRSTDVTQPYDECRLRKIQRRNFRRQCLSDKIHARLLTCIFGISPVRKPTTLIGL